MLLQQSGPFIQLQCFPNCFSSQRCELHS
uniref:Uncharacterized protein n=1 Tax=Arundo donax TaxID=35708 RepID=A0A0A9H2C4_ARUDO